MEQDTHKMSVGDRGREVKQKASGPRQQDRIHCVVFLPILILFCSIFYASIVPLLTFKTFPRWCFRRSGLIEGLILKFRL